MQVNPLLSNLAQAPQIPQQQNPQAVVTTQQSPEQGLSNAAVEAVGQNQSAANSADSAQNQKSDPKELNDAVQHLNDTANLFNTSLQFSIDPATGSNVVKVVDQSNNQVIRQIPSEEALRLSKAIGEFKGLLVKDHA